MRTVIAAMCAILLLSACSDAPAEPSTVEIVGADLPEIEVETVPTSDHVLAMDDAGGCSAAVYQAELADWIGGPFFTVPDCADEVLEWKAGESVYISNYGLFEVDSDQKIAYPNKISAVTVRSDAYVQAYYPDNKDMRVVALRKVG